MSFGNTYSVITKGLPEGLPVIGTVVARALGLEIGAVPTLKRRARVGRSVGEGDGTGVAIGAAVGGAVGVAVCGAVRGVVGSSVG